MSECGKVFKAYSELSEIKPDVMTLQKMFDHRFELIRQHELCTNLLDEIEAGQ